MLRKTSAVTVTLTVIWSANPAMAAGAGLDNEGILKGLTSGRVEERNQAVTAAIRRRHSLISSALQIARESHDGNITFGKKERAIRLLGEMRANEAVTFLLDNIGFRPPTPDFTLREYAGLPCVEALIKIGSQAARRIWEERLAKADERTLPLYLLVIKHVWGRDICRCLISAKLDSPLSDAAKANLRTALKYLEKKVLRIAPSSGGSVPQVAQGPRTRPAGDENKALLSSSAEVAAEPSGKLAGATRGASWILSAVVGLVGGVSLGAVGAWLLLRRRSSA